MHPPGTGHRQRAAREFRQLALEIPDAILSNAPGDCDMNRLVHSLDRTLMSSLLRYDLGLYRRKLAGRSGYACFLLNAPSE
jgi:hypothetical protein